MSDEAKYFAVGGKMHSAHVIAELDFDFNPTDPDKLGNYDKKRYLSYMLGLPNNNMGGELYEKNVMRFVERPGKWYFMTGYTVIHSDDVFDTREEVAQAEYDKLMAS